MWLWRNRILEYSRRTQYVTYTWNIRIEYGGIRSVHNRSWIFVKVYHTSVVLLEYDGESFVKRILWKKVTVRVHSILLEAKFRLWMQSMCDMRVYTFILEYMILRQSYRSLGYSWRLQLWRRPGICPPLGSSHNIIWMNGIHRDFHLSSKGVKFRSSGFPGEFILLALK